MSTVLYFSGKKAEEIPADVWELGVSTQVTDVNFSKNTLKQWPSKYVHKLKFGFSRRTLTMFMGVVALRYQDHTTRVMLIMECHNSDKHSRSILTSFDYVETTVISFLRCFTRKQMSYLLVSVEALYTIFLCIHKL